MPEQVLQKTAVGIMAKQPRAGRVKTRLAATIGDIAALDVYTSLLNRICKTVRGLDIAACHRCILVDPPESVDFFMLMYPGFDSIRPQCEGDLGRRMHRALAELLRTDNVGKAILVGTDIPEIDPDLIAAAIASLDTHDAVVGPTDDGGYYLIGMSAAHEALFDCPGWGTDTVLSRTLELAQAHDLSIGLLPTLRDLDTRVDLDYFTARGLLQDVAGPHNQ